MFNAQTQAVGDSVVLEADTQAVTAGNDSQLLGAATQALVGRLGLATPNSSSIFEAETQALQGGHGSPLLGSATQALVGQLGLGTSSTSLNLDSPRISSANSSTDSLLGLATQPVFKFPNVMSMQNQGCDDPPNNSEAEIILKPDIAPEAPVVEDSAENGEQEAKEDERIGESLDQEEDQDTGCDLEATQCPESFADLAEAMELREAEFQNEEKSNSVQNELETRCSSSISNTSDNLLVAAAEETGDDLIVDSVPGDGDLANDGVGVIERCGSVASNVSDNLLEAAVEEDEDGEAEERTRILFLEGDGDVDAERTRILEGQEYQERRGDGISTAIEENTKTSNQQGCLSKTTLGSVSMIESSQPVPTLQKAASSLRNHTNYNSIAMDQTETVDSEIFFAEEEERPDESTHPIGEENCSSNNSSDTAVVKAGEDIKDASVIQPAR